MNFHHYQYQFPSAPDQAAKQPPQEASDGKGPREIWMSAEDRVVVHGADGADVEINTHTNKHVSVRVRPKAQQRVNSAAKDVDPETGGEVGIVTVRPK